MINCSTLSGLLRAGVLALVMSQTASAQEAEAQAQTQAQAEAPASITLTLPDGSKTTLLTGTIRRIRRAIAPETQNGARTRIDWLQLALVREAPEEVAELVGQSVAALAKLRMPEGSPIWFNAGIAQGPMPLTREQLKNGVRSGIILGDSLQFLGSAPEEVRQELTDKGGNALPELQAIASLSPQGKAARLLAQKAREEAEKAQQLAAAQTGEAGQAEAEAAPEAAPTQLAQAPAIGIVRVQQAQAQPAAPVAPTQPAQPQQVGQIIRIQRTQPQQAPQPVQSQPEPADEINDILLAQQAPVQPSGQTIRIQTAQAQPVGQIIRIQQGKTVTVQQAQAEQAPQVIRTQQAQAEQVGEIIRVQQLPAQPGQIIRVQQRQPQQPVEPTQPLRSPFQDAPEWLDGFTEFADATPASKLEQRTAANVPTARRTRGIQLTAKMPAMPTKVWDAEFLGELYGVKQN